MKTKIIILLSFIALITTACQIYQIQNDEFRNNKTVSYRHSSTAKERQFAWYDAYITYQRVIANDDEKLTIYLVVTGSVNNFNLEKTAYLKADNKIFEVQLSALNTDFVTSTKTETNTNVVRDSTKTGVQNSVKTETKTTTSQYMKDKFIIETDKEMVAAIQNSKELLFRLYYGGQTATFVLSRKQLGNVKNMFHK